MLPVPRLRILWSCATQRCLPSETRCLWRHLRRGRCDATFVGGTLHALPFVIDDTQTALKVAYTVVGVELVSIGWVRRRFLRVPLPCRLVQVTLGGCVVAGVGALIGDA
jgi:hypothetical protein